MSSQTHLQNQIDALEEQIAETRDLLHDPAYAEIAKAEINRLEEQKAALEQSLEALTSSAAKNPQTPKISKAPQQTPSSAILEIRAAAGGNEAGLFATDLARMYTRLAQNLGWKIEELSRSEGGLGNIKEISLQIKPLGFNFSPYQLLQHEAGVHRVQRVPVTEKSGRIHTSTATVAVLPVVSPVELKLDEKDLKIESFRSSGPGGQHMQKTESAVRITHLPTGITASSQEARHQQANKEHALTILRARLYEEMQSQQKESLDDLRAEAVGRGQRAEKIRTYNFPQNRLTDHRLKKSWHNLTEIMDSNLLPILKALQALKQRN